MDTYRYTLLESEDLMVMTESEGVSLENIQINASAKAEELAKVALAINNEAANAFDIPVSETIRTMPRSLLLHTACTDGSTPVHSPAPGSITARMPASYTWSLEKKIQQQQASLHPHRPSRVMRAGRAILTTTWKVKRSEKVWRTVKKALSKYTNELPTDSTN